MLSAPDVGYIASDTTHSEQAARLGIPDHKATGEYRDLFLCPPMAEIRLALPAALLDHVSFDDIRSESTLLRRVKLGYAHVLYGIICRQSHHAPSRWIDIYRFPVRISYANKVRRVFEKRHKDS